MTKPWHLSGASLPADTFPLPPLRIDTGGSAGSQTSGLLEPLFLPPLVVAISPASLSACNSPVRQKVLFSISLRDRRGEAEDFTDLQVSAKGSTGQETAVGKGSTQRSHTQAPCP